LLLAPRIVLHTGARPVIQRVAEPRIASVSHSHLSALPTLPRHRSDAAVGAKSIVVRCKRGCAPSARNAPATIRPIPGNDCNTDMSRRIGGPIDTYIEPELLGHNKPPSARLLLDLRSQRRPCTGALWRELPTGLSATGHPPGRNSTSGASQTFAGVNVALPPGGRADCWFSSLRCCLKGTGVTGK
jgi:hypothetical protein